MEEEKFDIENYRRRLDGSTANDLEVGDGFFIQSDYLEFVTQVDILASEYGLGGCRSLTEFANMVDEEDPVLIDTLLAAMTERYRKMYDTSDTPTPSKAPKGKQRSKTPGSRDFTGHPREGELMKPNSPSAFAAFLKANGVSHSKVNEAIGKIQSGEIKPSSYDFSQITTERLRDPDFNITEALQAAKDYKKTAVQFELNIQDFGKHVP